MEKEKIKKIGMWAGIVLIVIVIIFGNSIKGIFIKGKHDDFAKYLTERGVKMYGTNWCSHCRNQKKLFGESFRYINFVDCDKQKQECVDAGVRGYPTWYINGQNYPGEQSLEMLARLSGYDGEI